MGMVTSNKDTHALLAYMLDSPDGACRNSDHQVKHLRQRQTAIHTLTDNRHKRFLEGYGKAAQAVALIRLDGGSPRAPL